MVVAGLILIVCSPVGKLSAALTTIPLPILGGVSLVTMGMSLNV